MGAPAKPLKILVAAEDEVFRGILKDILRSERCAVAAAASGSDVLRQLTPAAGIDLVVSDIDLPEMNGLELLRAVRAGNDTTPIIVLTGNRQLKLAMEALKNGADDYLLKDDNLKVTLAPAIRKVLERHRLAAENRRLAQDLEQRTWELERRSLLDELTGVPNRKYFDRVVLQEWGRAEREQTPVAIILVDIDHFKHFNETYGQPAGDACLQRVATALSSSLKRSGDFSARYGGEEFVAVLPDTDLAGAGMLAERIRQKVLNLAIEHQDSGVGPHLSVSLGVVGGVPKRQSLPAELVRKVEDALQIAKRSGRNRVQTAALH